MDLLLLILCLSALYGTSYSGPEYDFETPNQEFIFKATSSAFGVSSDFYKNGKKSLKWWWKKGISSAKLEIFLRVYSLAIEGKELRKGGIKFWMYRKKERPNLKMQIIFHGNKGNPSKSTSKPFTSATANLNFKGWRGVWIGYEEFGREFSNVHAINKVEFKITSTQPGGKLTAQNLYLDLVRFVTSMKKQSRDLVVKKVGQLARSGEASFYDHKDFWQQTLRLHEYPKPRHLVPVKDISDKVNEIKSIENRLENWYLNVNDILKLAVVDDFVIDMAMDKTGGIDFLALKQKRWKGLQKDIEMAHFYYSKIDFPNNRPPLFSKVSDLGEDGITDDPNGMTKFGFMFARILLPLSLEYNFMSRVKEFTALGNRLCAGLKSSDHRSVLQAVKTITGPNQQLINEFMTKVLKKNKPKLSCASNKKPKKVNGADLINLYNENVLLSRIIALLDFLEFQGWAEGSGLGSLDHEMNKAGSGFMHSMFLLRKALKKSQHKERLNRLIKAMKWYCDFNEIYQPEGSYVYDGTTADRMRTILFYRLIIILMEPAKTTKQKKNRIRDMIYFKTWFKHALKINKGLGGVIKPDYTGFHHKTFYGSAYVPHALHNAALVQYLLEGTSFKLDDASKSNLRKALSVLRISAVKYSTPNSIGGRFPGYNQSVLAEHFPAYAYISYKQNNKKGRQLGNDKPIADRPDMFLRLLNIKEPSVKAYLEDGHIKSGIYYFNPIGSLDVLHQVSFLNCKKQCNAENSPSGHWSKNFAALSIHRRKDWSVAAKGFNRYTWDYESSPNENIFGMFASHGSLQISNSEASLKSYDVNDGWDWTRVPGATTVNVEMVNIVTGKARNYNPGNFAGGVSFIGSMKGNPKNGAFGMVFKNPSYTMKNKASPLNTMQLEFKKSFFFYNDLIVCLGSDINFSNTDVTNYYAQTTLFQDKLVDRYKSSTIEINSKKHDLRLLFHQKTWDNNQKTVRLKDTHGNTYTVKNANTAGLHVEVKDQESLVTDGCKKTKARYATAWFQHKKRQFLSCKKSIKGRPTRKHKKRKNKVKKPKNKLKKGNNNKKQKASVKVKDGKLAEKMQKKNIRQNQNDKVTNIPNKKLIKNQSLKPLTVINKQTASSDNATNIIIPNKKLFKKQSLKPNKVFHQKSASKHELNGTNFSGSKSVKGEATDSIYVNGINVDVASNEVTDRDMETVDDGSYLDGISDGSEDSDNVDDPDSHVSVKSIDDESGANSAAAEEDNENDVSDDADDRSYYDEAGMDGLGTDVNYDGASTKTIVPPHHKENQNYFSNQSTGFEDTELTRQAKQVEMYRKEPKTKKSLLNTRKASSMPIPLEDMRIWDLKKDTENSDKRVHIYTSKAVGIVSAHIENETIKQRTEINTQQRDKVTNNQVQEPKQNREEKNINDLKVETGNERNEEPKHFQIKVKFNSQQIDQEKEPKTKNIDMKVNKEDTDKNEDNMKNNNNESDDHHIVDIDHEVSKHAHEYTIKKSLPKVKHHRMKMYTKESEIDPPNDEETNNLNKFSHNFDNIDDNGIGHDDTRTNNEAKIQEQDITRESNKNDKNNAKQNQINKKNINGSDSQQNMKTKTEQVKKMNTKLKTINGDFKTEISGDKIRGTERNEDEKEKKMVQHAHSDKDTTNDEGSTNQNTNSKGNSDHKKNIKRKTMYTKLNRIMNDVKPSRSVKDVSSVRQQGKEKDQNPLNISPAHQFSNTEFETYNKSETLDFKSRYEDKDAASSLDKYEYSILIKDGKDINYSVISNSGKFHAIEFPSQKVYAYSFFEELQKSESVSVGPVVRASAPCMMMVELVGDTRIHIAVSNPAIAFQEDPNFKGKDICTRKGRKDIDDKYSPKHSDEVGAKMMFCVEGKKTAPLKVLLRYKTEIQYVHVNGQKLSNHSAYVSLDSNEISFLNLVNGFTTEVSLRISRK